MQTAFLLYSFTETTAGVNKRTYQEFVPNVCTRIVLLLYSLYLALAYVCTSGLNQFHH